jgi:hypothetical protein
LAADLTIGAAAAFHAQNTGTRRTLPPHGHVWERSEAIMGWTVACFCGNVYGAPPDQCNVCHISLDHAAAQATPSAAETHDAALVTDATLRPQDESQLQG